MDEPTVPTVSAQLDHAVRLREAVPGDPSQGPYPGSVGEVAAEVVAWIRDMDQTCASGLADQVRAALDTAPTGEITMEGRELMIGPFRIDLERARGLLAGHHCPMPHHEGGPPRTVEVVATQKLATEDTATDTTTVLGRKVPCRDAVVVRCDDEDCAWGREVTGLDPLRFTFAGLGYVDVPAESRGAE